MFIKELCCFFGTFNKSARDGHIWFFGLYGCIFMMAFMMWRRSGLRYFVVGFANLHAVVNLGENTMILRKLNVRNVFVESIVVAHQLTMDKFASCYLCLLVLIIPLSRSQT